jgi:hypothetical protein
MIRILEAVPIEPCRLKVKFSDGFEGVYSVAPERRRGVFTKLRAESVFKALNAEVGCEWPVGVNLCPASRHQEMLSLPEAALR